MWSTAQFSRRLLHGPVYYRGQRTQVSPFAGGYVYLLLRTGWVRWIHSVWMRFIRKQSRHFSMNAVCMYGIPERNFDPSKNLWMKFVSAGNWDGIRTKVYEDFLRWSTIPLTAWLLAWVHGRLIMNDKYSMFSRWKKQPVEA